MFTLHAWLAFIASGCRVRFPGMSAVPGMLENQLGLCIHSNLREICPLLPARVSIVPLTASKLVSDALVTQVHIEWLVILPADVDTKIAAETAIITIARTAFDERFTFARITALWFQHSNSMPVKATEPQ